MKKTNKKWPRNNLRQLREAAGLTLEQLADRTEPPTSFAMIAKLERGERELRREWIRKIAQALHCNEDDIIIIDERSSQESPIPRSRHEEDPIRSHLDLAINLWFNNGDRSTIHTLAVAAYKKLRSTEKDKNLDNQLIEGLILSSVMKLQSNGKMLNSAEIAFILWLFESDPKLFKDEFREFFRQMLPVDSYRKDGKPVKSDFFKIITGNSFNS